MRNPTLYIDRFSRVSSFVVTNQSEDYAENNSEKWIDRELREAKGGRDTDKQSEADERRPSHSTSSFLFLLLNSRSHIFKQNWSVLRQIAVPAHPLFLMEHFPFLASNLDKVVGIRVIVLFFRATISSPCLATVR